MEKKISELEENRKLQNEVIKNLQILVDHAKKEKECMAVDIKERDYVIYSLKEKSPN